MSTEQKKYSINRSSAAKILSVSPRTIDRYIKSGKLSSKRNGNKVLLSRHELDVFKLVKERLESDLERLKGLNVDNGVDINVDRNITSRQHGTQNIDNTVYDGQNNYPQKDKQNKSFVDNDVYMSNDDVHTGVQVNNSLLKRESRGFVDSGVYVENGNIDRGVHVDMDSTVHVDDFSRNLVNQIPGKELSENLYKLLYEEVKEELKLKQQNLEGANYRVGQLESQIKNMVPLLEYRKEQRKLLSMGEEFEEEKKRLSSEILNKKEELSKESFNRKVVSVILWVFIVLQPIFWALFKIYG